MHVATRWSILSRFVVDRVIVQVRAPVAEFQQRHDRKIDDRIKRRGRSFRILAGACVLDRADKAPGSARHLKEILDAFLTKPQDRALFDLEPKESSQ